MRGYVLNGEGAGNYLVCLQVGDLQLELLLQRHHDLHSVQAIKPEILLEMDVRGHLEAKQAEGAPIKSIDLNRESSNKGRLAH